MDYVLSCVRHGWASLLDGARISTQEAQPVHECRQRTTGYASHRHKQVPNSKEKAFRRCLGDYFFDEREPPNFSSSSFSIFGGTGSYFSKNMV